MKTKIIISLAAGILIGVLGHKLWQTRTATAGHWRAVKAYVAFMRDPSHAKPDPQPELGYMNPPVDNPEPHLAALVQARQLQHLDIVLPTVPSTNRAAHRHWQEFCERHPQDILYSDANPRWVAFPAKGQQPLHLNIWFPETSQAVVQQLIAELQEIGTKAEPTTHPTAQ
jgi:hypothetical protein